MQLRSNRWAIALAILAATVPVAACGDDGEDSTSDAADSAESAPAEKAPAGSEEKSQDDGRPISTGLQIDALEKGPGQYGFSKTELVADPGNVTIAMKNLDGNQDPHALQIEAKGIGSRGQVVQPGNTSNVSVDVKPGKYTFFCPVGNHRAEGMEGTLTVR